MVVDFELVEVAEGVVSISLETETVKVVVTVAVADAVYTMIVATFVMVDGTAIDEDCRPHADDMTSPGYCLSESGVVIARLRFSDDDEVAAEVGSNNEVALL